MCSEFSRTKRLIEINKKHALIQDIQDKYIAGPTLLSPMPGNEPITLNTREKRDKVTKKEVALRINDIISNIKVDK